MRMIFLNIIKVILTREPGGVKVSENIIKVMLTRILTFFNKINFTMSEKVRIFALDP